MSRLFQVLYIEDEHDIRDIVQLSLEGKGFELVACASGAEALNLAAELQPDLILIDVMMPEMDGPETVRRLRELPHLTATPVIFFTVKVHADDVTKYLAMGALGVISKPFNAMSLADEIRELLSHA